MVRSQRRSELGIRKKSSALRVKRTSIDERTLNPYFLAFKEPVVEVM
jgi:hypothetical protein